MADLANGLTRRGHEIRVALRPESPLLPEINSLPSENFAVLPLRNAFDVGSARRLSRLVREHKIEIVHAHMARDYPLALYAARQNPAAKLIITRHVLFPLNRLHSITLSQVARVIAVSEAVGRQLRAHSRVAAERIVVVPNGIDFQRFAQGTSDDRLQFRRQWSIPQDCPLIGSVGAIKALKGHEDFLRSAAIIRQHLPDAHFLISGLDESRVGANRLALETLIAKYQLSDSSHILGRVDNLAGLYAALDVFVSASHIESFGLVIAEAMASGTPVVATRTEGAAEIITNDDSGLLVPIKDAEAMAAAVMELIQDQGKRERLVTAARNRIHDNFGLERMVAETERVYHQVVNE
jgi:L-malate glycosyltransferase